ncbi:MAG: hypothetical protein ABL973_11980 [Micropepsaceae bacterium]
MILVITIFCGIVGIASADQNDVRLERLFNQLAAVRTPPEADLLVAQIDSIWMQSGSDTVDLLMSRAAAAVEGQDFDTAMQLLNVTAEMRPEYAEVWYRRAELLLQMDSQQEAAMDLSKAVRLEPRNFRAHALLGRLADLAGKRDAALSAYKRALVINPMYEAVTKRAGELNVEDKKRPPPI